VLEHATVAADLAEAVSGAACVVGFSGHRHGPLLPVDVRDAAGEIAALDAADAAALVFGPETSGLTQREIALCTRRALIPSHPDQPSLNLSHAVMVAAYEVLRARTKPPASTPPRLATHDEKHAMMRLLREGLRAIEALPEKNQEGYFREWEGLFYRLDLSPKEVRLLEHMARKMSACLKTRSRT
jgi:tRNA/rRNA methyltransferase